MKCVPQLRLTFPMLRGTPLYFRGPFCLSLPMFLTALFTSLLPLATPADTLRRAGDDVRLEEASVTAFRGTLRRSTAPSQSMSPVEMQRRGVITLTEALRTFSGVSVKDYGGIGGLKTVSIRSFGAQHTGVCYDGVAQTDAMNGQIDISRYNLDNVQRISFDMAGSDDIFRPAKLAGYVGVVTLETLAERGATREDPDVKAVVRYGSFGTYSPSCSLRLPLGKVWRFGAWGNYVHSDGDYPFRLRNGALVTDEVRRGSQVSQGSGEAYATGSMGAYGTLRLKTSTYVSSRGLPGSVILYTQHPTEHLWDRTIALSAQHTKGWGSAWRLRTNLGYTNAWNRYLDTPAAKPEPEDNRYRQQQYALSSVALWQGQRGWSVALAEDVDVVRLTSNILDDAHPSRVTSHTALSGKYVHRRLTAVGTLLGMATDDGYHRLLPSASLSCQLLRDEDLRLRVSYKESYRLPTFTDLYYLRIGNRSLRPERAQQCNAGLAWQHTFGYHRLALTADAYYNSVRDKIVAIPTMFVWRMRNVGLVRMQGIDLSGTYQAALAPWLNVQADANYSLQHAIDVTDATAKNYRHQIPYTPRHTGSAVISTVFPWFTASYTLAAVGERYFMAQNTPAYRIEPYCDHSVSLNRTFDFHRFRLHVSGEALNLGGRNYEVIKYYPMPGRQWRVTLRISL